jgi:predicted nuclease of predicted toxin-antitoxin system
VRFLADMGVSASTVRALRQRGHEAVHAGEIGLDRETDQAILQRAREEGRTVLTFDLDFGDLLAAGGQALPSVIVFRLQDETPASVTPRLMRVISERQAELSVGAIIVVEESRYRLRRLPI